MTLILITKENVSIKSIGLTYVNAENLILMWFMDYKWALFHFSISRKIVSLLISNHVFKIYLHLINAQGNLLEWCVSCPGYQFAFVGPHKPLQRWCNDQCKMMKLVQVLFRCTFTWIPCWISVRHDWPQQSALLRHLWLYPICCLVCHHTEAMITSDWGLS